MIRISKIFLFFTATLLLAWLLPWAYRFLTDKPTNTPFTLYSCVTKEFASIDHSDNGIVYRDASGKIYTDKEFDSILPMFYYRQLLSDGRLPDSLNGVAITPQQIGMQSLMLRHSPSDLNKAKPALYPLLEAMSGRVDLKMPDDVFRLGERIEFIDMKTNAVNERKSERFTQALLAKGFEFPARYVQGNPTTRKEYDEGYFLLDNRGELFHLKQLRGRPYVRNTGISSDVKITDIFITEFANRRSYALLSDEQRHFYLLEAPGYRLQKLPVEGFDPRSEAMMIIGDMFNWTVSVSGAQGTRMYALDANDYSLCDTLDYPATESTGEKVGRYLFPFELTFTSYDDAFVRPRIGEISSRALILNLVLAGVYLVCRRRKLRCALPAAAGIVLLGVFLFISLVVIRR